MEDFNYKICLIGMPGSGKTTIGRELAKQINFKFIDLDELIKSKCKLTVSEIFKTKGELYFRDKETKILKELILSRDKLVISTGGGIILKNSNILIKTYNIFLSCTHKTLINRLSLSKERPLLLGKNISEDIKKMLIQREKKYLDISDLVINANGIKKNTISSILEKINK